ncbi:MAG: hypothetical protein MZW92_36595 [Comamonadaceae bacterium]|nr:hypothetical protein [Comamonadaceae bacterium]
MRLAAPPTLMPRGFEQTGAIICPTVQTPCATPMVMGLRIQLERMKKALFPSISEYARFFHWMKTIALAKPGAVDSVCSHLFNLSNT